MNLIYNQTKIPKDKWRYGLRPSAATGCGWVAVYNALCILKRPLLPEEIIRRLERQMPVLNGPAGTFVCSPALLMKQLGYRVQLTAKREDFDEAAKNARVCILYYYWRRKWKVGIHFVTLRWMDDHFEGYNTFSTSDGPDNYGASLNEFLKRQGFFGCLLASIT